MKRTPLRPGKPLDRSSELQRKTRLRARNPERKAREFARCYGSEARVEAVRAMPCCVPGCVRRPSQNAHVRSKGAGGTWRDVVPLCAYHHAIQHRMGILTFEREYDTDLRAIAARVAEETPA
jgi:hypothetical protein